MPILDNYELYLIVQIEKLYTS